MSSGDTSSSTSDLIQVGMNVCYNHVVTGCNGGSYTGTHTMSWQLFYADFHGTNNSAINNERFLSTYPTSINGTDQEFLVSFTNTTNHPTYYWWIGSWSYQLTVSLGSGGSVQSDFVQAEGIFETPNNQSPTLLKWSPNTPSVQDWAWDSSGTYYVYVGSSYNVGLYNQQESDDAGAVATASITGSSTFSSTWNNSY